MRCQPHRTSKTARRRAIKRLERLNDQVREIDHTCRGDVEYEPNFKGAVDLIKEMRRIVRNADFTKTVRKQWSTSVLLSEIMLMDLETNSRTTGPIKIDKHLAELSSIVSALKAGEEPSQEALLVITKARSFFRRVEPGILSDRNRERFEKLVEEWNAFQRASRLKRTASKQKPVK